MMLLQCRLEWRRRAIALDGTCSSCLINTEFKIEITVKGRLMSLAAEKTKH